VISLTGQDGFGTDGARNFTPTAGAFTFGVCPPGGTSPICSVNPNNVAKVMDTIPPAGVDQSSEWNLTTGTAVLNGVTVP
jgi:glucoamylase